MGIEKDFNPVNLFSGFIYREEKVYEEIKQRLEKQYSRVDMESDVFPFVFTTYYNKEMGDRLYRRFVSFEKLIRPELLPDIKLDSNIIEIETSLDGNRIINLDPGYLSDANVIIATTKNYYQRVPLTKGIYAHMEYIIKGKKLYTLEWTYPDFKSDEYMEFFERLRLLYKRKIKEQHPIH